jgi:hypothetical protein
VGAGASLGWFLREIQFNLAAPWAVAPLVAFAAAVGDAWRRRVTWSWAAAGGAAGLLAAEGVALALSPPTAAIPRERFLLEAAVAAALAGALCWSRRTIPLAVAAAAATLLFGVVAEAATAIITTLYMK